jgi:hypothetical protein
LWRGRTNRYYPGGRGWDDRSTTSATGNGITYFPSSPLVCHLPMDPSLLVDYSRLRSRSRAHVTPKVRKKKEKTYLLCTKYFRWFMWIIRINIECESENTTFIHPFIGS